MDISKVRSCRIHPAIGIARVGGSEEGYFIGPEIPGEERMPPIESTASRTSTTSSCGRWRASASTATTPRATSSPS